MPRDNFVRYANLLSVLTIVSRVAGLVRDKAWSYFLGANWQFTAFWMGFQFPNLSRRIFGEGALTAAFVPTYTDIKEKEGRAAANQFASATVTLLLLALGGLTLIGEAIAIPIALSEQVNPHNRVAAAMIAIMLPYCLMICLVAILGAIATVHEKFTAQALSPIVLNLVTAAGAALCVLLMTKSYPIEKRIFWVAVSVLVAGMLQVAQMVPPLLASGVRLRLVSPAAAFRETGVGVMLKTFVPIMISSSAVQINTFMDTGIAWFLSPDGHGGRTTFTLFGHVFNVAMGEGAGAKLSYAQRIYMLPVGIFGVSVAMAVFPALAKAATEANTGEVKRLLVAGLRKTLFLSIPSSLGMILIAKPLLTLIYQGGETTAADVNRAYAAAVFFCLGIWAFEAQMVILRVFFVLKDTKTPKNVAFLMILLNFTLNMTLIWKFQEAGIALATTLAAIVQGAILLTILRRRLGQLGLKSLLSNVGKSAVAALVMVQVGYLVGLIPMPWAGEVVTPENAWRIKLLTAGVQLPLIIGVCGAVYVGITRFFKMSEVSDLPLVGRLFPRQAT